MAKIKQNELDCRDIAPLNLTGNVLRAPKTVHYSLLLPTNLVADPGEGPGGPGPPLFLDQTEARRAEKKMTI